MARVIKVETVWVNIYSFLNNATSFEGIKQNGFGRELGVPAMGMYS
ncbi:MULTISPECIES: hypothetical protein [unclassified Lysinibacillus]